MHLCKLHDYLCSVAFGVYGQHSTEPTYEYNLALSQRRAQAAVDYLVGRGIARDRMVAQGYGETMLVNECSNGVPCSREQHQANRRTEVTVLAY